MEIGHGISSGVAEAVRDAPRAAVQPSLLGERPAAAPGARRGPGRPKGARNRVSRDWREYLLSRHGSPLEALAELVVEPTAAMALRLGCDRLEAERLRLQAARELAPYLHERRPVAVQIEGGGLVALSISIGAAGAPGALPEGGITIAGEIVSDQEVAEPALDQVARLKSHAAGISASDQLVTSHAPLMDDQQVRAAQAPGAGPSSRDQVGDQAAGAGASGRRHGAPGGPAAAAADAPPPVDRAAARLCLGEPLGLTDLGADAAAENPQTTEEG